MPQQADVVLEDILSKLPYHKSSLGMRKRLIWSDMWKLLRIIGLRSKKSPHVIPLSLIRKAIKPELDAPGQAPNLQSKWLQRLDVEEICDLQNQEAKEVPTWPWAQHLLTSYTKREYGMLFSCWFGRTRSVANGHKLARMHVPNFFLCV